MSMTTQQIKNALADLEKDLPLEFPNLDSPDLDLVRALASKLSSAFRSKRPQPFESLVVDPVNDGDLNDVIHIKSDDGKLFGLINIHGDESDDDVANAIVFALDYLRVPARRKAMKLVGCPVCGHYHPTNFDSDCRDDISRFSVPSDTDDIADRFDNGDPGTDLLECEHTHEKTIYIDAKRGSILDVRNLPNEWSYAVVGEDKPDPKSISLAVLDGNKVEVGNLPDGYGYEVYDLDSRQE